MIYLSTLILSLFITVALIPILIKLAMRFQIVDQPDARKVHTHPIPRIGGIAIVMGTVAPIILWQHASDLTAAYLGGTAILVDNAYNANPESVRKALQTMQELRRRGTATAILGDMLELGERAEELHEEIGTLLTKTGVDAVFLKGTLTRAMAAAAIRGGFPAERITFFDDPGQVIDRLRLHLKKGDWILIKGSRKTKMEEVAEALIKAFDLKP